ncbi:MAG: MGMT family protein [bacterium]|nr:MGMT family protein [bacterium]
METLRVPTDWGVISIAFSDKGIISLYLPGDPALTMADEITHAMGKDRENYSNIDSLLKRYFSGSHVDFSKLKVDLSRHTAFFRDICRAAQSIPYGELRTYSQLAEMAGRKNAARAAGRVMAANSIPIIIPCHRVVSSDGSLTGYSAPGGLKTKKELLMMEGVCFDKNGRVIN